MITCRYCKSSTVHTSDCPVTEAERLNDGGFNVEVYGPPAVLLVDDLIEYDLVPCSECHRGTTVWDDNRRCLACQPDQGTEG